MTIRPADRAIVEGYSQAMRLGAAGATALTRLFTDDAVYIEPFSGGDGQTRTHVGRDVIAEFFRDSVNHRPPDMVVTMNRIDAEGQRVRAEWTCTASVFAESMRGVDLYTLRDGKIARLETTLVPTRSR
jgi:ketosteroid isomerase-like protein